MRCRAKKIRIGQDLFELKRILYFVNNPDFFLSHRLPIALHAMKNKYEVHVAGPQFGDVELIRSYGITFHPISMTRSKGRIIEELRTLMSVFLLLRRIRPDILHNVTVKPVIYGSLAARLARVSCVVNAISGLGYVFIAKGLRSLLLRSCVKLAYRIALRHSNQKIIFQNPDDKAVFIQARIVEERDCVMIKGSGVDASLFHPGPEASGLPMVVLPARMLWDKGVGEFVDAARILQSKGVRARFILAGEYDPGNPACISEKWLREKEATGVVEWWGRCNQMEKILREAQIVCLPSFREGMPKALIEAAACGKPIVTTDVPGCREIVRDGYNGLLVPVRESLPLADAIARLLDNAMLRVSLGDTGRRMVLEEFTEEQVVAATLGLYGILLANLGQPQKDFQMPFSNRNEASMKLNGTARKSG